jgi:tetratricopeptide (TPR) repeat protein
VAANLHSLAELDRLQGDYAAARRGFEESLAMSRELGRPDGVAARLRSLAELDRLQGDYAAARRGFEESLAMSREQGDSRGVLISSLHVAATQCLLNLKDTCQQMLALVREADAQSDPLLGVRARLLFAECLMARQDFTGTEQVAAKALATTSRLGLRGYEADCHAWRAVALIELGRPDEARTEARQALAFFRSAGVKEYPLLERLELLKHPEAQSR